MGEFNFGLRELYYILCIIGGALIGFLISFLTQRSINRTNRKDIELLASTIASVDKKFDVKAEELRESLVVSLEMEGGILSLERDTIVNFNKSFFSWYNSMSYLGHDIRNSDALEKNLLEVNKVRIAIEKDKAELMLLIKDPVITGSLLQICSHGKEMFDLYQLSVVNQIKYNHDDPVALPTRMYEIKGKYVELVNENYFKVSSDFYENHKLLVEKSKSDFEHFRTKCREYIFSRIKEIERTA